jgi:epoxyqueuosine reductase
MKELIRNRALELGFDDCRFTTAAAPADAGQFQRWLAGKQHGEMTWLERTASRRTAPQMVLPGAKSIIVLATSYGNTIGSRGNEAHIAIPGSENERLLTSTPKGVIARYARFNDYHHVLGERLKALTEYANQRGVADTRSLWYVDTGPLLERDFAQRAGIGFIGKHANVISRRFGNWVLLAEILTTLKLEPDAPEKNRCGSCVRCMDACPTRAINAPFQLDARLCISYLTIELKGAIPLELRPAIGNRIFGCDDCLAVCPWNRFAREGRLMTAHARPDLATPDLVALLQLDEPGFKLRFAGTPILRTKRRGLLRNVCVALGNVGDASSLPALQKASGDTEPLIAEHARWALERIQLKQSQI